MLARALDLSKDRVEIDFNQAPGDTILNKLCGSQRSPRVCSLKNVIGSSTVQQAIRAIVLIHLEVISSVAHLRGASPRRLTSDACHRMVKDDPGIQEQKPQKALRRRPQRSTPRPA
jgi:hypothetical protein